MAPLRFAVFGTGFWSRFQLAAWQELDGVQCVALYNRTRARAEALADAFGVPAVYDDPEELLLNEQLDFVDVITNVETHSQFVHLVAAHGLPVICQKPMATALNQAKEMLRACQDAGVPLFIHENWRWQTPIRRFKAALDSGEIGQPFRARIHYCSSFPVFDNQPFLKELERFILTDMGSHILDVARFLFGEATSLYCQTHRVHPDIQGEDVATAMMQMGDQVTVLCEISYASRTEIERFPETYIFVEGDRGALTLGPDFWVRVTTEDGVRARRYPPPRYAWADPAYDLVHSSIVPCNENLLHGLRGTGKAETTGEDNLETMRLVFAAYESAASGQVLSLGATHLSSALHLAN
jgi:predicted dehydrogenase